MLYKYVAYNPAGERVERMLEAESEERVEELLWQSNLTIVSLKRHRQLPSLDEALPTLFGVKREDIVAFSRQLASILEAGIGILPAIEMVREQISRPSFRKVLQKVIQDLQTGVFFSEACSRHPAVFPPIFLRLMTMGEETGNLVMMLKQVGTYLEKEAVLGRKLRRSLIYPSAVMMIAIFAMIVLINFVLPALQRLFTEFKGQLPLITRMLLQVAGFMKSAFPYLVVALVVLVVFGWWYSRRPEGAARKDRLVVSLPLVGNLIIKSNMARIFRTMAMLLGAGVSVVETLDLAIRSPQSQVVREALVEVRSRVHEGETLSQALAAHAVFPRLVGQMVRVGEETGRLEANLNTLATFYEEETDRAMTSLTAAIEPTLILAVGLVVGLIAVSVITPIYSLIGQVR